MDDRAEIIELISKYADIADRKQFDDLPTQVFTDPVTVDFSSVAGIPPMTVPLASYVESLRPAFAPFAATHHAITGTSRDRRGPGERARPRARRALAPIR